MTQDEVQSALRAHALWNRTGGSEGVQWTATDPDLSNLDLAGADLAGRRAQGRGLQRRPAGRADLEGSVDAPAPALRSAQA